ncbi:MAG TPA: hypothetical protein VG476_13725 [Acidimicrobiales bacterium]|nr:hypothetical protein [Acidimicrobiales bacterium]
MKLRARALAVLPLGGPALLVPAQTPSAASLSLPLVSTCTAADTIAPSGASSLTTVGTSACSNLLAQQATTSIELLPPIPVVNLGVPLSTSSASCTACTALVGRDSATVLPVSGLTYQGSFVDTITAPAGSTFLPTPGCTTTTPNVLVCTATSTYTY